jgi:hypothetical protein
MPDRKEPETAEERNLRVLVAGACRPDAPALPSGLPARLAARARGEGRRRIDLPLAAAACSAAGLVVLAAWPLLPAGRTDLRSWALILPAVNLLVGPLAAVVVVRHVQRGASHAET